MPPSEQSHRRRLNSVGDSESSAQPSSGPAQPALAPVTRLRPRSRRRRDLLAQWPLVLVLIVVGVAVTFVGLDQFRIGSILLAVGVLTAFVLRLLLPASRIGMLAVRGRSVDLTVLGLLGGALLVFALWVPPPS